MAARNPEKATPGFAIQHQNELKWYGKQSVINNENRVRSKLVLTLLGLLSFAGLARIYSGYSFLASSTISSVSRSELELPQDSHSALSSPEVLECFQVSQPVLSPNSLSSTSTASNGLRAEAEDDPDNSCSAVLMDHVFGFSYGKPFVGTYTPPNCPFNRVIMNFTVVSQGRQFDRLALMYFGDTEVWRTSTAEPTQPPGIRWTFLKDMTEYLYFWKSPQKLIFDLGNLIDDKYTGSFNATLTATFFVADVETNKPSPADVIIPISARKGGENVASHFTLPAENATNTISFPQNVNRAVFSISANGQAAEEFWWGNVLQSDVHTFSQTTGELLGLSPFREVQLLIDGKLAGIQWPFPVIFTGGVVPSLHRPIVGLQAFDLREHQIDITPFLPLLCDGAEHTFTIKVAGLNDRDNDSTTLTDTVNDSWYVTGKVFLWLDEEGSVTTGVSAAVEYDEPTISLSHHVTQNATGINETLAFNAVVERTLTVRSTINSKSYTGESTWTQILSYSNQAVVSNFGFTETNNFTINGVDSSTGSATPYKIVYMYPLFCNQTVATSPEGNLTISARLIQGLELQVEGSSVFPTGLEAFENVSATRKSPYAVTHLKTYRDGTAFFTQTGDRRSSSGYGTTNQIFRFGGSGRSAALDAEDHVDELYFRNVTAANGTVVFDSERIEGRETYAFSRESRPGDIPEAALTLFAHVSNTTGGSKLPVGKGVGNNNKVYELPLVQVPIS
ncbi:hypothetical protein F4781DRAFT_405008 [Annulohypoxylon bovei var. microspora]|nr:hypothetical protein F4781DRAFT_405008 [Annulohypoxylon bovei var. microspora]